MFVVAWAHFSDKTANDCEVETAARSTPEGSHAWNPGPCRRRNFHKVFQDGDVLGARVPVLTPLDGVILLQGLAGPPIARAPNL